MNSFRSRTVMRNRNPQSTAFAGLSDVASACPAAYQPSISSSNVIPRPSGR